VNQANQPVSQRIETDDGADTVAVADSDSVDVDAKARRGIVRMEMRSGIRWMIRIM